MSKGSPVAADEVILKRIPPFPDNTKPRPDIGLTATSYAIRPRADERFPSWSRRVLTDPQALLRIEQRKGRDISGWHVAAVTVGEVEDLKLRVIEDPTPEDPGHCLIVPTPEQPFTNKIWSRLAKLTRIVYTHSAP